MNYVNKNVKKEKNVNYVKKRINYELCNKRQKYGLEKNDYGIEIRKKYGLQIEKKANAPDKVSNSSQKFVRLIKTQSILVQNSLSFSIFTLLNVLKIEHWAKGINYIKHVL